MLLLPRALCALCALCGVARLAVRGSWLPWWCSLTATATTSLTELPHKSFGAVAAAAAAAASASASVGIWGRASVAYGKFINFFIQHLAHNFLFPLYLSLYFSVGYWQLGAGRVCHRCRRTRPGASTTACGPQSCYARRYNPAVQEGKLTPCPAQRR